LFRSAGPPFAPKAYPEGRGKAEASPHPPPEPPARLTISASRGTTRAPGHPVGPRVEPPRERWARPRPLTVPVRWSGTPWTPLAHVRMGGGQGPVDGAPALGGQAVGVAVALRPGGATGVPPLPGGEVRAAAPGGAVAAPAEPGGRPRARGPLRPADRGGAGAPRRRGVCVRRGSAGGGRVRAGPAG